MFNFSGFSRLPDAEAPFYEALREARNGLLDAMAGDWDEFLGDRSQLLDLAEALTAVKKALADVQAEDLVMRWYYTREGTVDSWRDRRPIDLLLHSYEPDELLRFFGWSKDRNDARVSAPGEDTWRWCRRRFRDFLDAVLAAVKPAASAPPPGAGEGAASGEPDEFEPRPPKPTAEWCLRPNGKVRWIGPPVYLTPRLYNLLKFLLARNRYPVEVTTLAEQVWGQQGVFGKTLSNTFSRLNNKLLNISFPWTWHIRDSHVEREARPG
jgi:hypothetical protein